MCITGRQPPFTSTHRMSLYYSKTRLSDNLIYTVDHTFSYHMKISSVHAHGEMTGGGNLKLFKTAVQRATNGRFAAISEVHIRASEVEGRVIRPMPTAARCATGSENGIEPS